MSLVLSFNIIFIDIDECANNTLNLCEQRCINTQGDFMCACNTGFELTSDKMTCSGNWKLFNLCKCLMHPKLFVFHFWFDALQRNTVSIK